MSPKLTFPLLAVFGATRGLAGAGVGLLLADRLARKDRKRLGIALFAVGAASTIPLAITVFRRSVRARREAGGVMEPMTEIYTPTAGTVDAAEAEIWQAETPNIRP